MTNNEQFRKAAEATQTMVRLSDDNIRSVLLDLADEMVARSAFLLSANKKDMERMDESDPRYDRLMLTQERIEGIAADMRSVANMQSPLGKILDERSMPSGLHL